VENVTINSVRKLLFVGILLGWLMCPSEVLAGCSVSVNPNYVTMGTSSVSRFSVSNTGEQMGNWVRLQSPGLTAFVIAKMEATGWYPNGGGVEANFAGGYLEGGTSGAFDLTLAETGEVISAMDWEALLSYDAGSTFESCGSVSLQVIPAPVAPQISNVSLTVGNSSATVSFNTDLTATGTVNYGVTSGYGSSATTNSGTSHAATMSRLSSSTTYHYQIQATSVGGTTSTVDATFTTSAANVTTTTTTTVTNTVTTTETVTKVITDTTPPVVKVDGLDKKVWESAPLIAGSVSDDRGVAKVEYRIKDREMSWSGAGLEGSVGAKKNTFELLPPVTLDGTYTIEVRGVDVFGNASVPKTIEFVIDQLLPTVGGGVISYGALPLHAKNGVVTLLAGREYEIVLYENGGADNIQLAIHNSQFTMQKVGTAGLWRGVIKTNEGGEFVSTVKAVDGAGNETEREWVKLRVLEQNKLAGELYYLDPTTKRFGLWEATQYGQKQGEVGWYVPAGEYYVQNQDAVSQRIVMETDGWIAGEWKIGEARWWERLLGIKRQANLAVTLSRSDTVPRGLQVGREKWIGKKSVVYVGTTELPWYGESKRRAEEWASREGAQLVELRVQGVDDPKGEWLEKLKVGLLPQGYLVNDRGDIVDYQEGVWER